MKIGDRVYVLSGLEVEEWDVYEIDDQGRPWISRSRGFGMLASYHETYPTLERAVEASKVAREKAIRRCAREMERLALNTTVKVRLLKPKKSRNAQNSHGEKR